MIHPGSSLDKAINNTRVKNVSTDVKHGQIQERKRNFIYKKNDDISSRFKLYSSLVKQKNATEDVVLIGKMILDEVRSYRTIHNDRNIVSNSGNWKTSFYVILLDYYIAYLMVVTIFVPERVKIIHPPVLLYLLYISLKSRNYYNKEYQTFTNK